MASENISSSSQSHQIKVWDLPVRLFHWGLVLSIVSAYITNKLGVGAFQYHLWSGYAVVVLVVFRVLWGLFGTRHARFWHFVKGPRATLTYLRDVVRGQDQPTVGHNPLGAVMVLALLAALGVQAGTGLVSNDEIVNVGPLYSLVPAALSLTLTSLHRHLFWWIIGAVVLHVAAVLAHRFFKGENLVKAMITGSKPVHGLDHPVGISSSRLVLAALTLAIVIGGLVVILSVAPSPVLEAQY